MAKVIHLLGHGKQSAKYASDIKVGDVLMWNYGATAKVVEIVKETPKYIIIKEEYTKSTIGSEGETYNRRLLKTRLVAYVS